MKPNSIKIQQALHGDIDQITACINASYAKYEQQNIDLPDLTSELNEQVAHDEVWVCVENELIIGCVFLVPKEGYLKLENIAIHPIKRGEGLGRKLMEFSESEALRQGYCKIQLRTHVKMANNIKMYEHLGWNVIDQSNDTVSMQKILK